MTSFVYDLAYQLHAELHPGCELIDIAGSIRREKPNPKDIELVAIPAFVAHRQIEMFGMNTKPSVSDTHLSLLDGALADLFSAGKWGLDDVLKRNGPRYKRLRHTPSGICCDLFITDARRWGVIFTLRTGPGDFSKALVVRARLLKMFVKDGLLHGHPGRYDAEGKALPCDRGNRCPLIVHTPEEVDFLKALGLPWMEPAERSVEQIAKAARLDSRGWQ